MSDIAERVKKIVIEHLGVEEAKVTPEASFIDDLGADSLDTVELVMAFEEAFSVEIPEDAAEKEAMRAEPEQALGRKRSMRDISGEVRLRPALRRAGRFCFL